MIEKVIAAFFVSWVEISTQKYDLWCRDEKGVSMNVNLSSSQRVTAADQDDWQGKETAESETQDRGNFADNGRL